MQLCSERKAGSLNCGLRWLVLRQPRLELRAPRVPFFVLDLAIAIVEIEASDGNQQIVARVARRWPLCGGRSTCAPPGKSKRQDDKQQPTEGYGPKNESRVVVCLCGHDHRNRVALGHALFAAVARVGLPLDRDLAI